MDTLRFLGLDIELGEQEGTWLVHQQSYTHAFLQEMFGDYLKDRRTAGEPDSYSNKPDHHAHKARVKHPVLQPDQDPLEHTPILRLVGVLLWVSLHTRPDISWAVAKITRLASSDESRARVCVKHVAQYLKWTLHFALFYEPVTDRKWHWMRVGHLRETIAIKLSPFTMTRIWLLDNLKDSLLSLCRVQKPNLLRLFGEIDSH